MDFSRVDFKEEKIQQVLEHSYVLLERMQKTNFSHFFHNTIPDAIINKIKRDTPLYFTCLPQKYLDELRGFYVSNTHVPIVFYYLGLYEEFVTDSGRINQNSIKYYQKGSEFNDPYCNFKIAECMIRNNEKYYLKDIITYLLKSFLVTCIDSDKISKNSCLENNLLKIDSFHYLTYYYDQNYELFIFVLKEIALNEKFSTHFVDALLLIFQSFYDVNQMENVLNLLREAIKNNDHKATYFYCVLSQIYDKIFPEKFKINSDEILYFLDQLSNEGNFYASERLGLIFDSKYEYKKAFIYFSRSEVYLLPTSLRLIGNSYCSHKNILGNFDPVKSYEYWKKAFYLGTFGVIFIDYTQKNGDFERLKVLCELGVELNLYGAHYLLGKCYEKGRGVDQNFKIALSIYKSRFSNKKDLLFYSLYRIAKINEIQGNYNISNQLYKVVFLIHKWFYDQPQDNIEKSILNSYRMAVMLSKGKGIQCDRVKANLLLDEIYAKRFNNDTGTFISSHIYTKVLSLKEKNLNDIRREENNMGPIIYMKNSNQIKSHFENKTGLERGELPLILEIKEKKKKNRRNSRKYNFSSEHINLNTSEHNLCSMNKSKYRKNSLEKDEYYILEKNYFNENLIEDLLYNELDDLFLKNEQSKRNLMKIKKDINSIKQNVDFINPQILKIDQEILNNMNSIISFGRVQDIAVTIKEYKINNDNQLRKAVEEMIILSGLRHPNINQMKYLCISKKPLRIISINEYMSYNLRYILMELKLNLKGKLKSAIQILEAVNYLHSQQPPIVHCDLKPENILVDEESNIQICNFGLSKVIWNESLETDDLFTTRYSPPELIKNRITSKARDIWAIGLIFYEIFYGVHLFEEKSMNELIEFLMNSNEIEIKNNHFLSSDITNLIKRCLSFEFEKRPMINQLIMEFHEISNSLEKSQTIKFMNY